MRESSDRPIRIGTGIWRAWEIVIAVSGTGGIKGLAVGTAHAQATADDVTTSRSVYLKPGLSVTVNGPGSVKRFSDSCT